MIQDLFKQITQMAQGNFGQPIGGDQVRQNAPSEIIQGRGSQDPMTQDISSLIGAISGNNDPNATFNRDQGLGNALELAQMAGPMGMAGRANAIGKGVQRTAKTANSLRKGAGTGRRTANAARPRTSEAAEMKTAANPPKPKPANQNVNPNAGAKPQPKAPQQQPDAATTPNQVPVQPVIKNELDLLKSMVRPAGIASFATAAKPIVENIYDHGMNGGQGSANLEPLDPIAPQEQVPQTSGGIPSLQDLGIDYGNDSHINQPQHSGMGFYNPEEPLWGASSGQTTQSSPQSSGDQLPEVSVSGSTEGSGIGGQPTMKGEGGPAQPGMDPQTQRLQMMLDALERISARPEAPDLSRQDAGNFLGRGARSIGDFFQDAGAAFTGNRGALPHDQQQKYNQVQQENQITREVQAPDDYQKFGMGEMSNMMGSDRARQNAGLIAAMQSGQMMPQDAMDQFGLSGLSGANQDPMSQMMNMMLMKMYPELFDQQNPYTEGEKTAGTIMGGGAG